MLRILPFLILLISSCNNPKPMPLTYQDSSGAIRGYDPVAYFTVGRPTPGKKELSFAWNGAEWHFASTANLDSFKAMPEHYAPQYGGYCAYGTAEGHKAPTEPDAWTILDGKLYLNYNKDVLVIWSKDRSGYIKKADSNWTYLREK